MPNILKSFAIDPREGGYRVRIETEGGVDFECLASFGQLDLIAEDIDRQLDADQDPSH
ncbi:hypothetical protein [Sphingomonas oryzagri]